jgi:hypothetical protein
VAFEVTVTDDGVPPLSDTRRFLVAVEEAADEENRAPVLATAAAPTLDPMDEDDVDHPGTRIADLIASVAPLDLITDADAGAVEGLAVTAAGTDDGAWEFSLDDGATWLPLGEISDTAARLLAADAATRLRFVPAADFAGAAEIGFRAWDQTSGVNGALADPGAGGGAGAFSAETGTATIVVRPVNDPPVAGDDFAATTAGRSLRLLIAALLANDRDVDGDELTFTLPGAASARGGTLSRKGDGVVYTPPAGFTGEDTFVYRVTDPSGAADEAVVTVTVGPGVPVAPNTLAIERLPDGSVQVRIAALPGVTYTIEATEDAVTWRVLGAVTTGPTGLGAFTDTTGVMFRAYRFRHP